MSETGLERSVACRWCRYDLRAETGEGRCPECGTPVVFSVDWPPQRIGPPATPVTLAADAECVRCGAELSGCSSEEACPGCGVAAWVSRFGDWLSVRDPEWLRRVRRGMGLLAWAVGIEVVLNLVRFTLQLFYGLVLGLALSELGTIHRVETMCSQVIGLVGNVLTWAGVWFLTSPRIGKSEVESSFSLRRMLRGLVVVGVVLYAVHRGWGLVVSDAGEMLAWYGMLGRGRALVDVISLLVVVAYLARLFRAFPHRQLYGQMWFVFWGLLGAWVLMGVAGEWWVMPTPENDGVWRLLFATFGAGLVLFLVCELWLLVVLIRGRRMLRRWIEPEYGKRGVADVGGGREPA